jgi:adenosylcobinamide kinase / adenosylcobinamide-phosphate guanylyltransferase
MHELILGGAKSGKSSAAEARAAAWLAQPGHEALLVATALPGDAEMQQRIQRHRHDRARSMPALACLELAGSALSAALREHSAAHRMVVVDCLTLWLTQRLFPLPGAPLCDPADEDLVLTLADLPGPVVLVSNEIGLGVMPMGADTRRFLDALGLLHQQVAQRCSRVTLMVAGCALALKGVGS